MPPDDNPAEAGTGEGTQSLSLEEAAAHMVEVNRDREEKPDTAQAPPEDTGAPQVGTDGDETARKGEADEDWLADEASEEQKPEGEADETPETGQFVGSTGKVRMPDGSFLSVAELVKGHMFQSDYSRKTEAVSVQAKAAEARLKAAQDLETSLTEQREMVIHFLSSVQPQPPDPALAKDDPLKWIEANAAYQDQQQRWAQWVTGFKTNGTKQREAMNAEITARNGELEKVEYEKFREKVPIFKNPVKAKQASEAIKKELTGPYFGYKPEETDHIIDHRFGLLAFHAVRDILTHSKAKAAIETGKQTPSVQKPGQRVQQANQVSARIIQLQKQADKTGAIEDFAALNAARNAIPQRA